jgi:hypothetical protein
VQGEQPHHVRVACASERIAVPKGRGCAFQHDDSLPCHASQREPERSLLPPLTGGDSSSTFREE